jgi:hypothetical protein
MIQPRRGVLIALITAAALSRLLPHPANFTPLGAMALFGGACFQSWRTAILVPLAALAASDLLIGIIALKWWMAFEPISIFIYGSFLLIVYLGFLLRERRQFLPIALAVFASALLYFVITTLGVWLTMSMYSMTWDGLVACFAAALPYFQMAWLGDVVYSTALFGALALAERWQPGTAQAITGVATDAAIASGAMAEAAAVTRAAAISRGNAAPALERDGVRG